MAIYLKKFETQAAYEAAESGLILPNVSLTLDNNTVHYNPTSPVPPTPSHDYVEIGGVKWATMNIGANSITDTGLYFQWADTQGYTASQCGTGEGQKYFDFSDYKYSEIDSEDDILINKYDVSHIYLDLVDDAVNYAWGGNWRTPTYEELEALINNTNPSWVNNYQNSGTNGLLLTDKLDNSKILFFPAQGRLTWDYFENYGDGYYWTNTLTYDLTAQQAQGILIQNSSGNYAIFDSYDRCYGFLVRGILDE